MSFALGSGPRHCPEWRRAYLERPRTREQLQQDLVVAFDRIEKYRVNRNWTRIVTACAIAQWGLILLLIEKCLG